jgi:peroxiredoxin
MGREDTPRSHWIKPVVAGLIMAALAIGGYVAVNQKPAAPQVTFIDLKGQKISSDSLRGKVVMVNFWATSCVTCVKEMPEMVETYNKFHGQGLEFVAVAMKYDPPNYVINFTETRKLPFIVALDSGGDIAKAFDDVTMTPTTYVIDKDGKVLKKYVGMPDFAALHALLGKALAAG